MIVRESTGWDVLAVVRNMRASDAAEQFASRFDDDSPDARLSLAVELMAAKQMAIKHYALCLPDSAVAESTGAPATSARGSTAERASEWREKEPMPVALVGAFLQAPGVAALHRVATERFPEIALDEYRFLKRNFIPFVLAPNVRFAECRVPADDFVTRRWLGKLGFTPIGVPLPYGKDGRLFVPLAWINPAG